MIYLYPTKRTPTDSRYIANLPVDEEIGKKKGRGNQMRGRTLPHEKTIQALKNPAPFQRKQLAARNLFFVLDTTKCSPSVEGLNDALVPHWPHPVARLCSGDSTSITASRSSTSRLGKKSTTPFVDPLLPVFEESEWHVGFGLGPSTEGSGSS